MKATGTALALITVAGLADLAGAVSLGVVAWATLALALLTGAAVDYMRR